LSIHSKMSQVPPILALQDVDVKRMLACNVHLGDKNLSESMKRYVHKRTDAGVHLIDLRKTWEKLQLAARVIVAIENPKDICAVALSTSSSGAPLAQRAVLKLARYTGCRTIVGRITPGTFTNYQQLNYMEPRLVIASDPVKDHQPIVEASYINVPVIAFVNTNASLRGIDIAIPCNTSSKDAVALMYWMLAREVLRLHDKISREKEWDTLVDMFVYRDPEAEQERQTLEEQVTRFNTSTVEDTDFAGGEGAEEYPESGDWQGSGAQWNSEAAGAEGQTWQ